MKTNIKMSKLFIELPADKHRQLRIIAATEGKTMKDVILECIEARSAPLVLRPGRERTLVKD